MGRSCFGHQTFSTLANICEISSNIAKECLKFCSFVEDKVRPGVALCPELQRRCNMIPTLTVRVEQGIIWPRAPHPLRPPTNPEPVGIILKRNIRIPTLLRFACGFIFSYRILGKYGASLALRRLNSYPEYLPCGRVALARRSNPHEKSEVVAEVALPMILKPGSEL